MCLRGEVNAVNETGALNVDSIDDKSRSLIHALKQSYEQGDDEGVVSAYKQLTQLILSRISGQNVTSQTEVPDNFVPVGRFYEILGIQPLSSSRQVHIGYLRSIKKLLLNRQSANGQEWDFLSRLEEVCLAHDVLREPETRVDYDFRLLKVRGGGNALADELNAIETTIVPRSGKVHLKIGELLQSCEIIDMAELAAAVDMHKAMPEMLFGQFMVKSGFINQKQLDTVLDAQKLIGEGRITVAQFQAGMKAFKETGMPLIAYLKKEGWVDDRLGQQEPIA
jgi:hypothetical protein